MTPISGHESSPPPSKRRSHPIRRSRSRPRRATRWSTDCSPQWKRREKVPEKVPGTPLCLWNPIVDVDAVLRVFGKTRRLARATYVCELNIAEEEEWIGEKPGSLPWWRVGRPPKEEDDDPEDAIRKRRERERLGPEWRPAIPEDEFVQRGCGILGVDVEDIRSRSRGQDIVTGRALLMVLSVERYGLKVNATAVQIGQSSSGSSKALARGIQKRKLDGGFKKMLDDLDRRMAKIYAKV